MKVFGKVESERMPVRKVWDHAIDIKEDFRPSKAKVYPLSRIEREEVQKFVDEHLKKVSQTSFGRISTNNGSFSTI